LNLLQPLNQIGQVLEKGQISGERVREMMKGEEVKDVYKDRTKWNELIFANPKGKRA
jgi:hypothetical protein